MSHYWGKSGEIGLVAVPKYIMFGGKIGEKGIVAVHNDFL